MRMLSGGLWRTTLRLTGGREPSEMKVDVMGVGPDFFGTMQIPLLAGRTLTEADIAGAAAAAAAVEGTEQPPAGIMPAVVNAAFAHRFFPDSSAIGERL